LIQLHIYLFVVFNTDGQMIAIRLSKQVHKATTAIKRGVQLFNAVIGMNCSSCLPGNISEKDAMVPSSHVFDSVLDNSLVISLIVIDLFVIAIILILFYFASS
jgi:multisubunit Na+/H+ antiporter MnhC subunit